MSDTTSTIAAERNNIVPARVQLDASRPERPTLPLPEWRYLTPAMADALRSVPGENRPIKRSVVREYTRLMNAGLWRLSPHGISLGPDGRAADGNHRLTALASSRVEGLWFLVFDWCVRASELRVDRGSTRSLADFAALTRHENAAMTALACFLSIGHGNRRDPTEMQPAVNAFMPCIRKLLAECPTARRSRSTGSVLIGFCTAMIASGGVDSDEANIVAGQYRALVLNAADQFESVRRLGNTLDTQKMDQHETITKAYKAVTRPDLAKIFIADGDYAEARMILRAHMERSNPADHQAPASGALVHPVVGQQS